MSTESPFNQTVARIAVGAYDDAQDVRTSMMNRVRDLIRKRNEGIPFDAVEDAKDPEDQSFDSKYNDDNLPELIEEMRAEEKLSDDEFAYLEKMLEAGQAAARIENRYKSIMTITEAEPIYTEWLEHVYGVSTTLTARLIHLFGYCGPIEVYDQERERLVASETTDGYGAAKAAVEKATEVNRQRRRDGEDKRYRITGFPLVSNLMSYSGFRPDQTGRSKGERLDYNPQAKTLGWLVADRIIMQGERSKYKRFFYDPYKAKQINRMEQAEDMTEAELEAVDWTPPESQGHADNRARRKLAKEFLRHYWVIARDLKGLETPDEWVITHGGHEKRENTFENALYAKSILQSRERRITDA